MTKTSPFFHSSLVATADSLAVLHLKRESLLAVKLRTTADDGYAEGAVVNTRFGSYPHSTLIGALWGSQVRASKVDTGTRGRKGKHAGKNKQPANAVAEIASSLKRKTPEDASTTTSDDIPATKRQKQTAAEEACSESSTKPPIEAVSGFTHLLPPTPETWTASLDHRTQVVYIPDCSYILSRLRVKPGDVLIEAGAGSGSFTHAAARAVFNGYPESPSSDKQQHGRIYSFEYHEPRVASLREELDEHGLDSVVTLTHRDVCGDGFSLPESMSDAPRATCVFLDLPAPWTALVHLDRNAPGSPLSQTAPIRICTFSPCIEQVTATVAAMRQRGWTQIQMVEVANRRIDVRRERIGLHEEGLRGVNAVAASVDESLARLREVESNLKAFHNNAGKPGQEQDRKQSKAERLQQIRKDAESRPLYKEGRLVHKTEQEVKSHTSYLLFAVLPVAWSEGDEARLAEGQVVS